MEKPLVSIVTPCFNGEEYVTRFMNSILGQTYPNIELIFVNDGSTDRTENIVRSYKEKYEKKDIKFKYIYQENAGQAAALNKGLKFFSGEFLTWIDSDDEIMPEYIEKKVTFLQYNPSCMFCYGKAIEVSVEDTEKILRTYGNRNCNGRYDFFEDVLYIKNVFFSGYMVRTCAFDKAVLNREIYSGAGGQNAQMLLPLGWYYGEPKYVEDSVYKYYNHCGSHSHSLNTSEKIIEQLYKYEKILVKSIEKIQDQEAEKYIEEIKKHYARLRFGNAIDTKNEELIKRHYAELKKLDKINLHDLLLYIKYTNKYIRKCLGI